MSAGLHSCHCSIVTRVSLSPSPRGLKLQMQIYVTVHAPDFHKDLGCVPRGCMRGSPMGAQVT